MSDTPEPEFVPSKKTIMSRLRALSERQTDFLTKATLLEAAALLDMLYEDIDRLGAVERLVSELETYERDKRYSATHPEYVREFIEAARSALGSASREHAEGPCQTCSGRGHLIMQGRSGNKLGGTEFPKCPDCKGTGRAPSTAACNQHGVTCLDRDCEVCASLHPCTPSSLELRERVLRLLAVDDHRWNINQLMKATGASSKDLEDLLHQLDLDRIVFANWYADAESVYELRRKPSTRERHGDVCFDGLAGKPVRPGDKPKCCTRVPIEENK
jgi:hypothetical protein